MTSALDFAILTRLRMLNELWGPTETKWCNLPSWWWNFYSFWTAYFSHKLAHPTDVKNFITLVGLGEQVAQHSHLFPEIRVIITFWFIDTNPWPLSRFVRGLFSSITVKMQCLCVLIGEWTLHNIPGSIVDTLHFSGCIRTLDVDVPKLRCVPFSRSVVTRQKNYWNYWARHSGILNFYTNELQKWKSKYIHRTSSDSRIMPSVRAVIPFFGMG